MEALKILAIIFFSFAFLTALSGFFCYLKYFLNKKKEIYLKEKFNDLKLTNFEVRQKIIYVLADYNTQIDPICEYAIVFQTEFQHCLKIIEHDIKTLSKLNARLSFFQASEIEAIILKNFQIMDLALKKHDAIIQEATFSFNLISKIVVFYQEIVKNIIKNFEEFLSINYNGLRVNNAILEISELLITLEKNKTKVDLLEVEEVMTFLQEKANAFVDHLQGINFILISKSYLKQSILDIEAIINKFGNLKNSKEVIEIEKSLLKLNNYFEKIAAVNSEYSVEQKKNLIGESLKLLKLNNQKINYIISTSNIDSKIIENVRNWIYYFEQSHAQNFALFKKILYFAQSKNSKINSQFQEKITEICILINKLIKNKDYLTNENYHQSLGATAYIQKIQEILNLVLNVRSKILDLNETMKYVFKTVTSMITAINSYKISVIILNGKIKKMQSIIKIPYKPIDLILDLNQLEHRVLVSMSDKIINEELYSEILDIGYKIIEIGSLISNNQALLVYAQKLIIKFNRFYNQPKYKEALNEAIKHYNHGNFYKMVQLLIKNYNKFNQKYFSQFLQNGD